MIRPVQLITPCEGVIAVGQVKSTLSRKLLEDEFKKIASVKQSRRYSVHYPILRPSTGAPVILERCYGNLQNPSIVSMEVKKESSSKRQLLDFTIAGRLQMQLVFIPHNALQSLLATPFGGLVENGRLSSQKFTAKGASLYVNT